VAALRAPVNGNRPAASRDERRQVRRGRAQQASEAERQWQAMVDACVASKLIGSEAAGQLRPPITVEVDDQRTDRSQPLPAVK